LHRLNHFFLKQRMVIPESLPRSSTTASRPPITGLLTPGRLAFSAVRSAPLLAPHQQSSAPASSLVHAASTCRATARTGSGKRRKPCTTHEIEKTANVDEWRKGSKTGTNRWTRGRHRPMQMQQPRRQWRGRGRSSRACRSSRAEKKGQ